MPLDPARVVRGQYDGYLDADGVAGGSDTETLVAVEARIDNARWDGVPIYLRTGKKMPVGKRVITIKLKHPPMGMFDDGDAARQRAGLRDRRAGPHPAQLHVQGAGRDHGIWATPTWTSTTSQNFDPRCELEAYERLLHDAMLDDHMLFNRAEGIERLWEVSAPVARVAARRSQPYAPGTWGPDAVTDLIAPHHWHLPGI